MAHFFCWHNVIEQHARLRLKWSAPLLEFDKLGGRTHMCREAELCPVIEEQDTEFGSANERRVFENYFEHGFEVAWRTTDDTQHFGQRGLPLKCLVQLAGEARDFGFAGSGRTATAHVRSMA